MARAVDSLLFAPVSEEDIRTAWRESWCFETETDPQLPAPLKNAMRLLRSLSRRRHSEREEEEKRPRDDLLYHYRRYRQVLSNNRELRPPVRNAELRELVERDSLRYRLYQNFRVTGVCVEGRLTRHQHLPLNAIALGGRCSTEDRRAQSALSCMVRLANPDATVLTFRRARMICNGTPSVYSAVASMWLVASELCLRLGVHTTPYRLVRTQLNARARVPYQINFAGLEARDAVRFRRDENDSSVTFHMAEPSEQKFTMFEDGNVRIQGSSTASDAFEGLVLMEKQLRKVRVPCVVVPLLEQVRAAPLRAWIEARRALCQNEMAVSSCVVRYRGLRKLQPPARAGAVLAAQTHNKRTDHEGLALIKRRQKCLKQVRGLEKKTRELVAAVAHLRHLEISEDLALVVRLSKLSLTDTDSSSSSEKKKKKKISTPIVIADLPTSEAGLVVRPALSNLEDWVRQEQKEQDVPPPGKRTSGGGKRKPLSINVTSIAERCAEVRVGLETLLRSAASAETSPPTTTTTTGTKRAPAVPPLPPTKKKKIRALDRDWKAILQSAREINLDISQYSSMSLSSSSSSLVVDSSSVTTTTTSRKHSHKSADRPLAAAEANESDDLLFDDDDAVLVFGVRLPFSAAAASAAADGGVGGNYVCEARSTAGRDGEGPAIQVSVLGAPLDESGIAGHRVLQFALNIALFCHVLIPQLRSVLGRAGKACSITCSYLSTECEATWLAHHKTEEAWKSSPSHTRRNAAQGRKRKKAPTDTAPPKKKTKR